MIEGRYLMNHEDLSGVKSLWQKVFIEEMKMPQSAIAYEETDLLLHATANEGSEIVGVGTIEYGDDAFYISRIAVEPSKRRKKYGDFVLRMLINKAVLSGTMPVKADVISGAEPLFEEVGFEKSGEAIEKDGVTYQPYTLSIEKMKSCGCDCNKH